MILLIEAFELIKDDIAALEEKLNTAVVSPEPLVTAINSAMLQSGGKRLRPALCILAARAGKPVDKDAVIALGAALEMIHMASLMHDDVIDEADLRRGQPTVNSRYGNQIAVLAGDYLFARSFQVLDGHDYPQEIGKFFADLVQLLTLGEIRQDALLYYAADDIDEYYEHIEQKTAGFLAICCHVGALAAKADEAVVEALYQYGHNIGMAFQIADDILDITATEDKIGKPAGSDMRQGVTTLPVRRALQVSPQRNRLREILVDPTMTDAAVAEALDIVRASDGVDFSRQQAQEYISRAKRALPVELPEELAGAFGRLADFIVSRQY